ncbi:hypothetical protein FACS189490_05690 [Clostridia bacterium]|nr:hypothetical protein FACS189490_05690 [Clostridia bacterium]
MEKSINNINKLSKNEIDSKLLMKIFTSNPIKKGLPKSKTRNLCENMKHLDEEIKNTILSEIDM